MKEQKGRRAARGSTLVRWLIYFLISIITFFFITNEVESSDARHGWFDKYGQMCLCLSVFMSLVIILVTAWILRPFYRIKERGRHRRRMECSDLYGFSLFFSILLSVIAPFALLFGGVSGGLMPVLGLFAFLAFIFLFTAIELSLYQFIPESGWETVGYVAAALFVPPVAVALISTVLWLLGKLMAF